MGRTPIYVIGCMALAFGIRIYALGKLSLWLDEGITAYKMSLTCRQLLTYTEVDNVPPLYYLILHLFRTWIHTDTALRLPSVFCGTLTVLVLFLICRRLFDVRTAFLSCVLLSLSTFHVWFSQEARSYTLYCLCYALTLLFLVRWVQEPTSVKDLSGYVVCSALMLYSHSTALFYWATNQVIFIWLQRRYDQKKVWPWILAQGAVFLLFAPWVPSFLSQTRNFRQAVNLGPLDYTAVIDVLMILTSFAPLYPHEVSKILGLPFDPADLINLTWVCAFLGGVCLSFIRLDRRWFRSYGVVLLLVGLPLLSVTVFSVWIRNVFFDRMFIPSTLGAAMLLALGIRDAPFRIAKMNRHVFVSLFFCVLILAHLAISLDIYYHLDRKEDFHSAADFVVNQYQPGDLVLFVANSGETLFNWYQKDRIPMVRRAGVPRSFLVPPNQSPGIVINTIQDIQGLPNLVATAKRLWLVRLRTQYHDPHELTFKWMEQHCQWVSRKEFSGVKVDLFGSSDFPE
jgi:hypothetical protein